MLQTGETAQTQVNVGTQEFRCTSSRKAVQTRKKSELVKNEAQPAISQKDLGGRGSQRTGEPAGDHLGGIGIFFIQPRTGHGL